MNGQFKKNLKGAKMWNSKGGLIPWDANMAPNLTNANGDVASSGLGYQYVIQTTTQIRAQVIKQKFYEIPFADFVPVIPGNGAWMEDIKTNLTYDLAGPFEQGVIATGSGPSQLSTVDTALSSINARIVTWAKGYQYTMAAIKKALAAQNWDVVSGKLTALKKHWDLGLQKVAFLGFLPDLTNVPGLITNASVTINTSVITKNISTMTSAEFATLVATLLSTYFTNSNNTVLPDTFVIPMDDYLGLGTPVASGFPVVSQRDYLENMFKQMTGNQNFKIMGTPYNMAANNTGYITSPGKNRYVLYRRDPDTIKMDLPVDILITPAGTPNNWNWEGVGCGQFTGAIFYRPAEAIYFDHS